MGEAPPCYLSRSPIRAWVVGWGGYFK